MILLPWIISALLSDSAVYNEQQLQLPDSYWTALEPIEDPFTLLTIQTDYNYAEFRVEQPAQTNFTIKWKALEVDCLHLRIRIRF